MAHTAQRNSSDGAVGLFLVVLGSLFLADRLGYSTVSPLLAALGASLAWSGLIGFMQTSRGAGRLGSLGLFLLGTILVLNGTGVTQIALRNFFDMAWPLVLILLGVFVISARDSGHNQMRLFGDYRLESAPEQVLADRTLWSVIGDIKLDLTEMNVREGTTRISLHSLIGDIRITVPDDLGLQVHSSHLVGETTLFGRHLAGLWRSATHRSPRYDELPKKVHLNITSAIGDIRISSSQ